MYVLGLVVAAAAGCRQGADPAPETAAAGPDRSRPSAPGGGEPGEPRPGAEQDVSPARSQGGPPAGLACKDQRSWGTYLRGDRDATLDDIAAALGRAGVSLSAEQAAAMRGELEDVIKWRLIRYQLLDGDNHNFGQVELRGLRTGDGRPVRVYRTGFTPRPDQDGSCFDSLLDAGGVRHVVSLYAGDMPTQDLEAAERAAAEAAGATYVSMRDAPAELGGWRHALDEAGDDPAAMRAAMQAVAALIDDHVLRPGGQPPRGDIHIHCGGGMHRTGMIVGILEKCLDGAPMERIEAEYRRHVDWRSDREPGGYEAGNVAFIRAFDCALLRNAAVPPAAE